VIFLTPMRLGFFFRLTPGKTLKFKGHKCDGGKLSKDRIPVLFANADGTEKMKLLVTEKPKNPRCFKTCERSTCKLQCKKKAWMTSDLFEAEMKH